MLCPARTMPELASSGWISLFGDHGAARGIFGDRDAELDPATARRPRQPVGCGLFGWRADRPPLRPDGRLDPERGADYAGGEGHSATN